MLKSQTGIATGEVVGICDPPEDPGLERFLCYLAERIAEDVVSAAFERAATPLISPCMEDVNVGASSNFSGH